MSDSAADLAARYGPAYRWLVAASGMIGVLSMVLSMTTVNVAVPDVMGAFGIGQDQAQLMASAYMATMTAGMLLNSWVVGVLGERRTWLAALTVFSVGAVLGGTAPNENVLVLGRVLQGGSAGIAQPLVMALMFTVFPAERRGFAMGIFSLGVVFAPAVGPTIGGMLIEALSWRAVFFVSLPFCAIAATMGALFMPTRPLPDRLPPFDWLGFLLLCAAIYGIVSGISMGPREGFASDEVAGRLAIGLVAAAGFIGRELATDRPLLDLTMFKGAEFAAAAAVAFVFGAGLLGSTYLIPVFAQTVQGLTPLDAGLLVMPGGLSLAIIFPLSGRLSDSVPPVLLLTGGLCLFALGFVAMSGADPDMTFAHFAAIIVLTRVGLGLVNPTLNASALRAVPPDKVRQAAGAANFMRQLGGALGTNLLVAFLETRTRFHDDMLAQTQTWTNTTSRALLKAVTRLLHEEGLVQPWREPAGDLGALNYLSAVVHAKGVTFAYQDTFVVVAAMALCALVPAWVLGRQQRRGPAPVAAAPRGA